jgi:DnaK suppressor protein
MKTTEATRLLDAELERLGITRASIEGTGSETSPAPDHGPDTADSARELVEREEHEAVLQPILSEIHEARAAYARLLGGTYGTCEACGQPIADERLRALPSARYCVPDEQRRERLAPA